MGELGEPVCNRLAQSTRTHSMHNPDRISLGQKSVVQELVRDIQGFIHLQSNDVDFGFFQLLRRDVQLNLWGKLRPHILNDFEIIHRPAELNVPHKDFGFSILNRCDFARNRQRYHPYPLPLSLWERAPRWKRGGGTPHTCRLLELPPLSP